MSFSKSIYGFLFLCLTNLFYTQEKKDSVCPVVGLVLSGGGAKGYAHIGALKVLEENHIYPDRIGGTSMGAIIGGLYASGYTAKELDSIVYNIDFGEALLSPRKRKLIPFFDKKYAEKYILQLPFDNFRIKIPHAISKGQETNKVLTNLTRHVHGVTDFEELSTPFFCIATDLESGEQVILDQGFLAHDILASGAFPTLVTPQEIGGRLLVDGGVVNNFPAKEMRDKGADLIIGVDVQDDNVSREELKSITKVLEQIATLKNQENLENQKEQTDVFIDADIEGYGVIDFDAKEVLIKRGVTATQNKLDTILQLIPEYCRKPAVTREIKHSIYKQDSITVTSIELNGAEHYTSDYLLDKIDIDVPREIPYSEIVQSIDRLYATGNFSQVNFLIKDDLYGKRIVYQLEEEKNRMFLKLGLHYDNTYQTGFLTNLTVKNIFWKNSFLSTDVILGDKIRFNVNYLIDNGAKPSFGVNYAYRDVEFNGIFEDARSFNLEYDFRNHSLQGYIQSTLFDRYAFGLGMEYDHITIKTNNIGFDSNVLYLSDNQYLGPYFYTKIDNRDQPNFSKRGIVASAKYKWIISSDDERTSETNSYFKINSEINLPVTHDFTVKLNGGLGITLSDEDLSYGQQFYLGGFNEQSLVNYEKFYGYDFMEIRTNNYFAFGVDLQYNLLKNHYISLLGNVANVSDRVEKLTLFDFDNYNGIGIQYGYNSPLGPMILNYSYSPEKSEGAFYIGLGFWF